MAPQIGVGPGSSGETVTFNLFPQPNSSTTSKTESTVDSPIPTTLISSSTPSRSNTNIGTSPSTNSLNLPIHTDTTPVPFNPASLSLPLETHVLISSSSMPISVSSQSSQSGTIQALDISSLSFSSTTIYSSILPTDSPTASSEAVPTTNIPGSPNTNTSRNGILGIAIILPILLICGTGLTVLYIWRRRRMRATLFRLYRTCQNGVDDWEGGDSSYGCSQTVKPFVLTEKDENAYNAVVTTGAMDTKHQVVGKGPLLPTGAQQRVPKTPALQSDNQNDDGGARLLVSEQVHLHVDTSRTTTSLPHEADVIRHQEVSATQNFGLDESNVRYPTRWSHGSLDAELRAYIPPPKYTSTGASLFLGTNTDPASSR